MATPMGLMPEEEAPPPAEMMADGEAATPEEQAQYEQIVDKAYTLIYDKKGFDSVLEMLGGADPRESLAQTAAMVVGRVKDAAQEQEMPLDEGVLFHAGIEVLESLADTAGKAGIHEFTEEEVEGALYRAMDVFRERQQQQGDIDPAIYEEDMAELIEADQQGRLGEIIPMPPGA